MTTKQSHADRKFLRIVGEVLHYIWDPIGVAGVPQARDEYHGYVGPLVALLRSGASNAEISVHLERIVVDRMGLTGLKVRSDKAASVLTNWHDYGAGSGSDNSFKPTLRGPA
jgi:hypothetical protein